MYDGKSGISNFSRLDIFALLEKFLLSASAECSVLPSSITGVDEELYDKPICCRLIQYCVTFISLSIQSGFDSGIY